MSEIWCIVTIAFWYNKKDDQSSYLTMASEENTKTNNGGLFLFDFDGGELINDIQFKCKISYNIPFSSALVFTVVCDSCDEVSRLTSHIT